MSVKTTTLTSGQNYWAYDLVLVIGEGYLDGLDGFMEHYYNLFNGVIWTALNVDYPGHSFDHIGLFYGESAQDPANAQRDSTGDSPTKTSSIPSHISPNGPADPQRQSTISPIRSTTLCSSACRRPSASPWRTISWERGTSSNMQSTRRKVERQEVTAYSPSEPPRSPADPRHRIDAITLYCPNATGPHGFHSLGKTIESSLRSFNNLLERLHASYFFYLIPKSGQFLPVGHYLPSAILLGASVTLGGFDCPTPVEGLITLVPVVGVTLLGSLLQSPLVSLLGLLLPRPSGTARRSLVSLAHLYFGALIPTLAMVNFPQAIVLAFITAGHLAPWRWIRLAMIGLSPAWIGSLRTEWEVLGNLAWVGIMGVWVPLGVIAAIL